MNETKWRVSRCPKDSSTNEYMPITEPLSKATAELIASSLATVDPIYWYSMNADPKPAEQLWRVHWRTTSGCVGKWADAVAHDLDVARKSCDMYNANPLDTSINWIQPYGTEPALKTGTEPIAWRVYCKTTVGTIGVYGGTHPGDREERQRYADELAAMFHGATYWIQPEPVPALKTGTGAIRWRIHWRNKASGVCSESGIPEYSMESGLAKIASWQPSHEENVYWIQPDGTEPALKAGTEPIVWRMHARYRIHGQHVADYCLYASREHAEVRMAAHSTSYADHWIQPEPSLEAKTEPAKVEPKPSRMLDPLCEVTIDGKTVKCSHITVTTQSGFFEPYRYKIDIATEDKSTVGFRANGPTSDLTQAQKPEPPAMQFRGIEVKGDFFPTKTPPGKTIHWRVFGELFVGYTTPIAAQQMGPFDTHHAAINCLLAQRRGNPGWHYWLQGFEKQPEPLRQVRGRCPDGTTFNVNDPTPYREASDLAWRLALQTKLGFTYWIADV